MTPEQPSILAKSKGLWDRQERHYLAAFKLALKKLGQMKNLPTQEIELNRILFCLLREAVHELDPTGKVFSSPVMPEACNPPDPDDEVRATREFKRPDFQWGYRDTHAEKIAPRYMWRFFVAECKRLGKPLRRNRILNQDYIRNGVRRFVEKDHGYASAAPSGLMIGYVQTMDLPVVLSEVNGFAKIHAVTEIVVTPGSWRPAGVSALAHRFDREFDISPFELVHFWVDLRAVAPVKDNTRGAGSGKAASRRLKSTSQKGPLIRKPVSSKDMVARPNPRLDQKVRVRASSTS